MKRFFPLLALVLLVGCSLLHSPPVHASTLTVTWVNPTTNTDGSTIADTGAESLASVRVEFGTCNGAAFGTKAGEFTRTRTTGQAMLTTATNNVPPGNTCVRALITNASGKESVASNVSATVVQPSTPNAPTNVTATSG